jgi:hypothetical protein
VRCIFVSELRFADASQRLFLYADGYRKFTAVFDFCGGNGAVGSVLGNIRRNFYGGTYNLIT